MQPLQTTATTASTASTTATTATTMTAAMPALRFLTAGSVDDGKSTLIGRLLYDSRAILADQIDNLRSRAAKTAGGAPRAAGDNGDDGAPAFDLSLLTDGLEAEREQGITIDVAYRYFATPRRKFIIADAPGHEQYTRNMVTAAAGSDAAVVLVDITKLDLAGASAAQPLQLLPQTRRHTLLAQLLRVPSIVFAVNKLDAIADPASAFEAVSRTLRKFATEAGLGVAAIVPVSALRGDNVTQAMPGSWYAGPTLLQVLEGLPSTAESTAAAFSLPVQYVARPDDGRGDQPRVLWGRVAQGGVRVGDAVQIFPSGESAVVAGLHKAGLAVDAVAAGQSAGVVLDRQLDVSRGDWLAAPATLQGQRQVRATMAWLDTEAATPGRKYLLRHGNRWVQARLQTVHHRLDIHTLQPLPAQRLGVNEIGEVTFELQQPLPLSPYADNRVGGSLIVVDPASHATSGALLVRSPDRTAAADGNDRLTTAARAA